MTRLLCFFTFLFFGFSALSQIPSKYDNLTYSNDSVLVLIDYKNKHTLFNLQTNKYIDKTGKNTYLYYEQADGFLAFDANSKTTFFYHVFNQNKVVSFNAAFPKFEMAYPNPYYDAMGPIININRLIYDFKNHSFINDSADFKLVWKQSGAEMMTNGNYNITNYCEVSPSIFDEYYSVIGYDLGYDKSGIYNPKNKLWLIEPIYKKCYIVNDYVFCLKRILIENNYQNNPDLSPEFKYSYDIYKITNDKASLIKSNETSYDIKLLQEIFGVDELEPLSDGVHYQFKKNNLYGFMRFQLYDKWWPDLALFDLQIILDAKTEYLRFSPEIQMLAAVFPNPDRHVQLYYFLDGIEGENNGVDELIPLIKDKEFCRYTTLNMQEFDHYIETSKGIFSLQINWNTADVSASNGTDLYEPPYFGAQLTTDNKLLIFDWSPDLYFYNPTPLISFVDPYLDSIDVNGNVVYSEPDFIGYNRSGVFDLNTKKWLIEPLYATIINSKSGYLVQQFNKNSFDQNTSTHYLIFDRNGKLLVDQLSFENLVQNEQYIRFLISNYTVDTLFKAPGNNYGHSKLKALNHTYYIQSANQLGVFHFTVKDNRIFDKTFSGLYDFVHQNNDHGFKFYLKNDSVWFENKFEKYGVPNSSSLKFVYHQSLYDYENWGLTVFEKNTITIIRNVSNYEDDYLEASIEMKNGYLTVNDYAKVVVNPWGAGFDLTEYMATLETENSSVWKKENGIWKKQTPYYAKIQPLDNGYFIAQSGSYIAHWVEKRHEGYHAENFQTINYQTRYFLLDNNLRPVGIMDWFDFSLIQDLSFGIKICFDNGCLFMTNSGEVITNAEWDDFLPEDANHIKAIRNAEYYDINGNMHFDQDGFPVEINPAKTALFKLP